MPPRLSAQERRVYSALLSRPEGMSSKELIEELYPDAKPLNARTAATDAARRLGRKLEAHGSPYRVRFGERAGPIPTTITLERT